MDCRNPGYRDVFDCSHALRGSTLKDALRPEPQERFGLHSHAERGNDARGFHKDFYPNLIAVKTEAWKREK